MLSKPNLLALVSSLGLVALLPLSSCSGSSSGDDAGDMFIESCSLGCSSGVTGEQVDCETDSTFQNQEIRILFSDPVDIDSVDSATFEVREVVLGSVPQGSYLVDPLNPRRLIFRPAMTINPATGQLEFGFESGKTYRVFIAGTSQDAGPYILSTDGKRNRSRLRCEIQPNGIVDVVPGNPTVQVFVDVQLFASGVPAGIALNQPAQGAVDVSQDSPVKIVFADVMNPLTLFSPTTGTSNFVLVKIDRDGNVGTVADQTPLPGTFTIFIDQSTSRTQLTFHPVCIPSAGLQGRKVVVTFAPGITDLSGKPLINPGVIAFTPEVSTATAQDLPTAGGETFADNANLDAAESGDRMWNDVAAPGRVVRGFGGGSGRLGRMSVVPGQVVVLDGDTGVFPASVFPQPGLENDLMTNLVPGVDYDPLDKAAWPKITVDDGIFEFSQIDVEPGGTLIIEGRNHARVFSRGDARVNGILDVAGETAVHLSGDPNPLDLDASVGATSTGARGGPNGGNGGAGGTRYDAPPSLQNVNITPPGIDLDALTPPVVQNLDGSNGEEVGLGVVPPNVPPSTDSPGVGGVHWPNNFPTSPSAFGDLFLDFIIDANGDTSDICTSKQVGGPGGGGAYATDGSEGIPRLPPPIPPATGSYSAANLPPTNTPGGLAVPLEPPDPESAHFIRKLSATLQHLRGGAGGGGGGTHLFLTETGGFQPAPGCAFAQINSFYDNSGAPGGGGGGALQLTSGGQAQVSGQIIARGGDGGSASTADPATTGGNDRRLAAPGGGGSGGAVRVQGIGVEIANAPARIDVRGGLGGVGVNQSRGGNGGRGLVRLEFQDAAFTIDRDSEAPKVAPYDPLNPDDSHEHMSVGTWALPRTRPECFSAVVSCWTKPALQDCFLELRFAEDVPNSTDPDDFGWNLDLVYQDPNVTGGCAGEKIFPYRGLPLAPTSACFPLLDSIENTFGNTLNHDLPTGQGSFVTVRFQGAQALAETLFDPCNVELVGLDAEILAGSLTPWVSHPAELNGFVPAPNMIRFAIIFDGSLAVPNSFQGRIKGVDRLVIKAQPD